MGRKKKSYSPMLVLEVRGREVGEDSSGSVSESVILRMECECLLSPLSFTSSSAGGAPLKLQKQKGQKTRQTKRGIGGTSSHSCVTCRSEKRIKDACACQCDDSAHVKRPAKILI